MTHETPARRVSDERLNNIAVYGCSDDEKWEMAKQALSDIEDLLEANAEIANERQRNAALVAELAGEAERVRGMRGLLEELKERHYNPFEPDNQSRSYEKICAALAAAPQAQEARNGK